MPVSTRTQQEAGGVPDTSPSRLRCTPNCRAFLSARHCHALQAAHRAQGAPALRSATLFSRLLPLGGRARGTGTDGALALGHNHLRGVVDAQGYGAAAAADVLAAVSSPGDDNSYAFTGLPAGMAASRPDYPGSAGSPLLRAAGVAASLAPASAWPQLAGHDGNAGIGPAVNISARRGHAPSTGLGEASAGHSGRYGCSSSIAVGRASRYLRCERAGAGSTADSCHLAHLKALLRQLRDEPPATDPAARAALRRQLRRAIAASIKAQARADAEPDSGLAIGGWREHAASAGSHLWHAVQELPQTAAGWLRGAWVHALGSTGAGAADPELHEGEKPLQRDAVRGSADAGTAPAAATLTPPQWGRLGRAAVPPPLPLRLSILERVQQRLRLCCNDEL
jgi:hypothetical protein